MNNYINPLINDKISPDLHGYLFLTINVIGYDDRAIIKKEEIK